jgi:lipoprotein-releasing system permease protein
MPRPFELFLAQRYLRPRRTFVSAITVLSVLGVTLGVMVLIVVLSVMAGFEKELRDKVIGFNAHLLVHNGGILKGTVALQEEIRQLPGVVASTPYAQGPVLAEFADRISTPVIRGVDPESEDRVIPLKHYLVDGEYELRGDSILIGQEWSRRNGAFVGDKVRIYSPRNLEQFRESGGKKEKEYMLPTEMTVTGIFSTGLFDYDLNFIVTSLFNAQRLYRLEDGVHGIAVRLTDPFQAEPLKKTFNQSHLWPLQARSWIDQNRPLFEAIATERVAMSFVLFFVMIVAAFGLCSTLITITVQKSREIGVLKALGARDGQVLSVFLLHGLIVGVLGSAVGLVLAQVILAYRNTFRDFLSERLGIDAFAPDIYKFPEIPAVMSWPLIWLIVGSAVAICVLAALIPAVGAARLPPAKALRYE